MLRCGFDSPLWARVRRLRSPTEAIPIYDLFPTSTFGHLRPRPCRAASRTTAACRCSPDLLAGLGQHHRRRHEYCTFTNDSVLHCPILDTLTTNLTTSGNVYAGTGKAVPVNNKGGEKSSSQHHLENRFLRSPIHPAKPIVGPAPLTQASGRRCFVVHVWISPICRRAFPPTVLELARSTEGIRSGLLAKHRQIPSLGEKTAASGDVSRRASRRAFDG